MILMKHGLLCLLILITGYAAQAQDKYLRMAGTVTTKDGITYSYLLQLTNNNGALNGYSVSDINGANETKTEVTGTLNTKRKELSFTETKLLTTKISGANIAPCFLHARLKISSKKGLTVLRGSFEGYLADGKTLCDGDVKLTLISKQELLAAPEKKQDTDTLPAAKPELPKPETVYTYETEIADSKTLKALPGKATELYCSSPTITIELWDAKTIDGDIITLQQDGNTVLENYTLTAQHKQLTLSMGDKKTTTLSLIAVSEGSEPMNTARIKIISGDAIYYIDATTTIGKNVTVVLKR